VLLNRPAQRVTDVLGVLDHHLPRHFPHLIRRGRRSEPVTRIDDLAQFECLPRQHQIVDAREHANARRGRGYRRVLEDGGSVIIVLQCGETGHDRRRSRCR
jgi:hypothetical protein